MGAIPDNSVAESGAALPTVSVIIRSVGRPTLAAALDSVARQTYQHVEVVVVNAVGATHPPLASRCGPFPLRCVGGERLLRSRAANAGLEAAAGDALIFLDDDDVFLPHHLSRLVERLGADVATVAAYSAIRCENENGETVGGFGAPFDRLRLLVRNFLPIHSVLFRRAAVDAGLRFDEGLDACEDWDFWLQLSERGPFAFEPVVGAVYRIGPGSGFGVNVSPEVACATTMAVYRKWARRADDPTLFAAAQLAVQQIESETVLDDGEVAGAHYLERVGRAVWAYRRLPEAEAELAAARHQVAGLEGRLAQIESSRSWRLTAPLRDLAAFWRKLAPGRPAASRES